MCIYTLYIFYLYVCMIVCVFGCAVSRNAHLTCTTNPHHHPTLSRSREMFDQNKALFQAAADGATYQV